MGRKLTSLGPATISWSMVRKLATAIMVLALLLAGFQPVNAPMAGAMASTMDMEQPCCSDCDQPARSDTNACDAMAGCVVAPSATILASHAVPAFFPSHLVRLIPDQSVAVSTDTAPPFRPPILTFA